jgi:hypothetical protein
MNTQDTWANLRPLKAVRGEMPKGVWAGMEDGYDHMTNLRGAEI